MYQVEQHQVDREHEWWGYCDEVCFSSKNLYNTAQYTQRQGFVYGHGIQSQAKLDKMFNPSEHYKALPAKVAQLVLKQNTDAWNGYFESIAKYKQDASKFTGCPKPPDYIEPGSKGRNLLKFNTQAISKTEFKKGFIAPSKSPIRIPVKPGLKFTDLVEVRIVPKTACYVVEVVYEDGVEPWQLPHRGLAASIDIGLDNLATIVFSDPTIQPIAVNGKPLKAKNQWMNKEVARLRSQLGFGTSRRIQNTIRHRNNFVHTYLHQATKMIVDELDDIGVTHVAIGKNPQWKTAINIGGRNNQQFVQIPHAKFIAMLKQKLERVGITVTVDEESFTSKASFLDWDEIPTWTPGANNKHQFSGKRIATKKYRSKDGTIIHADVNGAFNIGRKVFPNFFNPLRLMVERNRGCVVAHPRRISPKITRPYGLSRILPFQAEKSVA